MAPSFQRNARAFRAYLSSITTQTITRQPLACDFIKGGTEAYLHFRGDYAALNNGCTICIRQRIGQHPELANSVTTIEYLYAFRIGADPQQEPLVRYEYLSALVVPAGYKYPRGHVHLSAHVPEYNKLIEPYEKKPLHQIHFPAGQISLEDFIQLLVVEVHIAAHDGEEKALGVLNESRTSFPQRG